MGRSLLLFKVVLLIVAFSAPAVAWEFSMTGEFESRYRYIARTGPNDLFGMASAQEGAPGGVLVGFAGPNAFNVGALPTTPTATSNFLFNLGSSTGRQMLITRGGFSSSGSEAMLNQYRVTFRPTIKVNQAIKLRFVANLGGFRNKYDANSAFSAGGIGVPPLETYYTSQTSMNATDTAALISVEQFWATVRLPWFTFATGTRALPFGTGATFAQNTRSEMLIAVVPYGPFRFMHGIWLARSHGLEAWNSVPDASQKNDFFQGLFITYDRPRLRLGAAAILRRYHGNDAVGGYVSNRDDNLLYNLVYFKYNDGRFFANAEYAWMNNDRYRPVPADPVPTALGTQSQTLYYEGYHFFSELGAVMGPARLSLMYALASGPVLNNANRLRNVPAGGFFLGSGTQAPFAPGLNPKVYVPWTINYQALEPYEFLMFNTYAGGNNGGWNALDFTLVADEHGMMSDAHCFAARLDYALASNLNVWGSYIWAHRLERHGTYFGQYQSSGSLAAGNIPNLQAFYTNAGRSFGTGHDYVSDGFIGWEMNYGVNWELLQNLTFKGRYSYWQPGDWFKEAFQSVVIDPTGNVDTAGVLRDRDAIHAFEGSFIIDF